jgi:hypothetical protein
MAEFGPCAKTPKSDCLYVNKPTLLPLLLVKMGRITSRKSCARHFTPPSDLSLFEGQAKTPQRCGVLFAKLYSQELGIPIPQSLVRKVTGIAERNQSRILASKQPRTLYNQPDSGPDPRGRKRCFTRSDTSTIADYLDDSTTSLDDKGAPWLDITEEAGVQLPQTPHFKPPGLCTVNTKTLQQACKADEGLINAVAKEERELTTA